MNRIGSRSVSVSKIGDKPYIEGRSGEKRAFYAYTCAIRFIKTAKSPFGDLNRHLIFALRNIEFLEHEEVIQEFSHKPDFNQLFAHS
ncbi:hypothetical protein JEQ12_008859 [Ovis aries]|uniref:Uncharacterized protein n=1 Tax=Ovis aries TaxID=9940 RepID=A0A836AEY4_SHEEP|nr:hypothetical protein JEQ12_008859 [Ovis aries]